MSKLLSKLLSNSWVGVLTVPFALTATKQNHDFSVLGPSPWNGPPLALRLFPGVHSDPFYADLLAGHSTSAVINRVHVHPSQSFDSSLFAFPNTHSSRELIRPLIRQSCWSRQINYSYIHVCIHRGLILNTGRIYLHMPDIEAGVGIGNNSIPFGRTADDHDKWRSIRAENICQNWLKSRVPE